MEKRLKSMLDSRLAKDINLQDTDLWANQEEMVSAPLKNLAYPRCKHEHDLDTLSKSVPNISMPNCGWIKFNEFILWNVCRSLILSTNQFKTTALFFSYSNWVPSSNFDFYVLILKICCAKACLWSTWLTLFYNTV